MAAPTNEIQPVWATYVDREADVKPFLQWKSSDGPAQDQLLQDTIDAACWWAQDFLGRPIALTEFFRRFSGWQTGQSGSYVSLPYSPVVVDTSHPIVVDEYWGTSGVQHLVEQTPAVQGSGATQLFQLDALRGTIIRTVPGLIARPFFPGVRNIEVTWWAGYNPIPPTWKRGTLRLIKHWWDHDFQTKLSGFKPHDDGGYDHGEFFALVPDSIMSVFSSGLEIGIG